MKNLLKNEMILEQLLRRHGITRVVFSVDGQNSMLYRRIARDPNYTVYCAADERSAAYFAMGIAVESEAPAAVVCRSNLNAGHFYPAATEAFYQNLPLLMLAETTGEMEQDEVPVSTPFETVTRSSVRLGAGGRENVVEINRALTQLTLWGGSPVFLSYPADAGEEDAEQIQKIDCLKSFADDAAWEEKVRLLEQAKAPVLVLGEQYRTDMERVRRFADAFGCRLTGAFAQRAQAEGAVCPCTCGDADLVITLSDEVCPLPDCARFRHWSVGAGDSWQDPYGCLDTLFVAPASEFLDFFLTHAQGSKGSPVCAAAERPQQDAPALLKLFNGVAELAAHGIVQTACRWGSELFEQVEWKEDTRVYANSSTLSGGAVSTFLGVAFRSGRESYLIVDDLSFYNDMNSLMTRNIEGNLHILLLNAGAAPRASYTGAPLSREATDGKLAAWIAETGFEYLRAESVEEACGLLTAFGRGGRVQPIVLEVFADDVRELC